MIPQTLREYETLEDDGVTGWYYHDEPHGGFLVADVTEVGMDDRRFRLALAFKFTDLQAACGEDGYLVEAVFVPFPDTLTESHKESIASSYGMAPSDLTVEQIGEYGLCVPITNAWGAETWDAGYEEIVNQSAFMSFAPGFAMDRPMNRLGTTGWDMLRDAVDDVNAFDAALDRLRT